MTCEGFFFSLFFGLFLSNSSFSPLSINGIHNSSKLVHILQSVMLPCFMF